MRGLVLLVLLLPLPLAVRSLAADAATAEADYAAYKALIADTQKEDLSRDDAWWQANFVQVCDMVERFIEKYPDDPRRWPMANIHVMYSRNLARSAEARMEKATALIASALIAKDISERDWIAMKSYEISAIEREFGKPARSSKPDLSTLRRQIDELAGRYPEAPHLVMHELKYQSFLQKEDPARARAFLQSLAAGKNAELAKVAEGKLRVEALRSQSLAMKFTALDGRSFDFEQLRGKIVLIDFWATWCGPCIAELPSIQAVYEKYHDRGFEVIGISCDQPGDKKKLQKFIDEHKIPWPQFFDEENKINRFAREYSITAIPVQMLFNRDGLLISDKIRGDNLEAEVKKALGL